MDIRQSCVGLASKGTDGVNILGRLTTRFTISGLPLTGGAMIATCAGSLVSEGQ